MELHLNLVHLLFLHGISAQLFAADKKKMHPQWRSFVHDMCIIMETYIDAVDEPLLKEKMNYKPIPEDEESQEDKIV